MDADKFFNDLEKSRMFKIVLGNAKVVVFSYETYGEKSIHVWKGGIRVNVFNCKGETIDTYADDDFKDSALFTKEAMMKRIKDSGCLPIDF